MQTFFNERRKSVLYKLKLMHSDRILHIFNKFVSSSRYKPELNFQGRLSTRETKDTISADTRPLRRPTSRANQGRNNKIPPPVNSQVRRRRRIAGAGPDAISTGPPLLPRSARPSSSLVFITRVTNDSISIHICSDWSMRETIVSGVSCAPTARPAASLSALHLAQTNSVCSAFSIRDPQ